MGRHTIILVQFTTQETSKKWADFQDVNKALSYLCSTFEEKLKRDFPNRKEITYNASELMQYIDSLPDCTAMVFAHQDKQYVPYGKTWIKQELLNLLKNQLSN